MYKRDTYQKIQYAKQVRQLQRQATRPARQVRHRPEEGSDECVSTRMVFCNTCGQEVQERFFKSHGQTCWPLMLEYPDEAPQAPVTAVPAGYGNWHEAQGTVYAAQA